MLGLADLRVQDKIYELIELKAGKNEDYVHPREPLLDGFLHETILKNEQVAQELPAGKGDIERLDDFYRNIVLGWVGLKDEQDSDLRKNFRNVFNVKQYFQAL